MLKFKKMSGDRVPMLLITANVGSIFEDPSVMLPIWTTEFLQFVSKVEPKFIALHMQEVGGKTYEKSMQYVQEFVKRLCDSPELKAFDKIRTYLDEDFSCVEKFTALGNMYFIHSTLTDVRIWDWQANDWASAEGKETHCGNIEKVTTKEKVKFPQHLFPECKWSRKGFLRTRWHIRGTSVELINIHLFHDASNMAALTPFPSVYARSRRRALRHTLRHLHADSNTAPYFIFGDFNFRTDTGQVVKKLTQELSACRLQNGSECDSRLQYRRSGDERTVLSIAKKEFSHLEHQKTFRESWLLRFDRELEALRPHLYEFPIKFPPSYPFEEDVHQPTHYMKTRCPAWCDRVLLSQTARLLIQHPDPQRGENKHLHTSRKSVADSNDSSARASSSDSSPARSGSPQRNPPNDSKTSKLGGIADMDGLLVPGINVARKSIADPTGIQHAINARVAEGEGSPQRRRLVRNQSEGSPKPGDPAFGSELRRLVEAPAIRRRVEYGVIGEATCMGDHKPIYLRVMLQSDRGTLQCGLLQPHVTSDTYPTPPLTPRLRSPTDPDLASRLKSALIQPLSGSYPDRFDFRRIKSRTGSLCDVKIPDVEITSAEYSMVDEIFVNDIDTTLLYSRSMVDPYTPESIDSHSPNPETNEEITEATELVPAIKLKRDQSVSPTQLKSRLDKLLISDDSKKTVFRMRRDCSEEPCYATKCFRVCRRRCMECDACAVCSGRSGCNQFCRCGSACCVS